MKTYEAICIVSKQKGLKPPLSESEQHVGEWTYENTKHLKDVWKFMDSHDKKYIYMITFTLRPEEKDNWEKAEEFIVRQAKRTGLYLTSFAYSREYTKQGIPHWHVVVECLKPIKKNRFDYYAKKFGFVDISRTKGQTNEEALQYISKESSPTVLL